MNPATGKILMLLGAGILVLGIIVYLAGNKLDFIGRLPGDIRMDNGQTKFYFPITTCILASVIVTAIFKLIQWFMSK